MVFVFGNRAEAALWLISTPLALGGRSPYELLARGQRQDILKALIRLLARDSELAPGADFPCVDRSTKPRIAIVMTKPRRKRGLQPNAKFREAARQYLANPPLGPGEEIYHLRLEASQLKKIKRLARERGTTIDQEIGNAIDACLFGLPPPDVRMLNAMLARFKATMDKNNRSIEEALRAIGQSNARLAHLERSHRRGRR